MAAPPQTTGGRVSVKTLCLWGGTWIHRHAHQGKTQICLSAPDGLTHLQGEGILLQQEWGDRKMKRWKTAWAQVGRRAEEACNSILICLLKTFTYCIKLLVEKKFCLKVIDNRLMFGGMVPHFYMSPRCKTAYKSTA